MNIIYYKMLKKRPKKQRKIKVKLLLNLTNLEIFSKIYKILWIKMEIKKPIKIILLYRTIQKKLKNKLNCELRFYKIDILIEISFKKNNYLKQKF